MYYARVEWTYRSAKTMGYTYQWEDMIGHTSEMLGWKEIEHRIRETVERDTGANRIRGIKMDRVKVYLYDRETRKEKMILDIAIQDT